MDDRLKRFYEGYKALKSSGQHLDAHTNLTAIKDMVSPVAEDVQDILNKYGPIGAPIMYAVMERAVELLWAEMDKSHRMLAKLYLRYTSAQRISIRRCTDENQE